jgi:hypothetical protein
VKAVAELPKLRDTVAAGIWLVSWGVLVIEALLLLPVVLLDVDDASEVENVDGELNVDKLGVAVGDHLIFAEEDDDCWLEIGSIEELVVLWATVEDI